MSIQLVPSFSSHRHTVWYVIFAILVFVIWWLVALYSMLLCLLWVTLVVSYFLIHYIQSLPLVSQLYDTKITIGAFVLSYQSIKNYRLITRTKNNKPILYGICIQDISWASYYYTFRDSLPRIRKRITTLDHYVSRAESSSTSLYEEILDIAKI